MRARLKGKEPSLKRETVPFLPKGERPKSFFFAEELLYEYLQGRLDAKDKKWLHESLKDHPPFMEKMKRMELGLRYLEQMGQQRLRESFRKAFLDEWDRQFWKNQFSFFHRQILSYFLKHPRLSFAVAMVFLLLTGMILMPFGFLFFKNTPEKAVLLGEMTSLKVKKQALLDSVFLDSDSKASSNSFLKSVLFSGRPAVSSSMSFMESSSFSPLNPVTGQTHSFPLPPPPLKKETSQRQIATVTRTRTATTTTIREKKEGLGVSSSALASASAPVAKLASASAPVAKSYFLHKVFVFVSEDLDFSAQSLRESLEKLGAEKAGKAKLGKKLKGGYYFHFFLPKESHQNFLSLLDKWNPVIKKEEHKRKVKEDLSRFVLWMESKYRGKR